MHIANIRNERENTTTDPTHIQRKICKCDELHYENIFVKFNEMDTFLKEHSLLKLIR